MKTLPQTTFNDFENRQIIWELYGELLDFYADAPFTTKQIAYETNHDKKLINKVLHRLIQHKAVELVNTDHFGLKTYRLNEAFTN
jgi:hypothetical protein